jgi:hypothetical protein
MVKVANLLSQLLTHIPSAQFGALARRHQAERAAKGFSCWPQLVACSFATWHTPTAWRDL